MKNNNTYLFLIIQALLTLLLLFADSYVKYVSIVLFCLFDIVILFTLFGKKWLYAELFAFTTFFVSLLFLLLYIFAPSNITIIIGVGVMILFLLSALLMYKEYPVASMRQMPIINLRKITMTYI